MQNLICVPPEPLPVLSRIYRVLQAVKALGGKDLVCKDIAARLSIDNPDEDGCLDQKIVYIETAKALKKLQLDGYLSVKYGRMFKWSFVKDMEKPETKTAIEVKANIVTIQKEMKQDGYSRYSVSIPNGLVKSAAFRKGQRLVVVVDGDGLKLAPYVPSIHV